MKKTIDTKKMCITALATAIICLATMIIQIPIPLGYAHLGDSCIILISLLFGWKIGLFAGGVGSALADLLGGFPQWVLPTLIIKCIMGAVIALIGYNKKRFTVSGFRTTIGMFAGLVEMIAGYVIAGSILSGSIAAGMAQIPGLALKAVVNVCVFYVVGFAISKTGLFRVGNGEIV